MNVQDTVNQTPNSILLDFQKYSPEVFYKKGVLKSFAKFTGEHLCQGLKKEKLTQVFSSEYCEIFRTPFLQNTFW